MKTNKAFQMAFGGFSAPLFAYAIPAIGVPMLICFFASVILFAEAIINPNK